MCRTADACALDWLDRAHIACSETRYAVHTDTHCTAVLWPESRACCIASAFHEPRSRFCLASRQSMLISRCSCVTGHRQPDSRDTHVSPVQDSLRTCSCRSLSRHFSSEHHTRSSSCISSHHSLDLFLVPQMASTAALVGLGVAAVGVAGEIDKPLLSSLLQAKCIERTSERVS
jgi:hypothetical protein